MNPMPQQALQAATQEKEGKLQAVQSKLHAEVEAKERLKLELEKKEAEHHADRRRLDDGDEVRGRRQRRLREGDAVGGAAARELLPELLLPELLLP